MNKAICKSIATLSAVLLAAALDGCTGKAAYLPFVALSGGGINTCQAVHPLHATMMGCIEGKDDITPDNANDTSRGSCLLAKAAQYGRPELFRKLIENGAKPAACTGERLDFYELWIVHQCRSDEETTRFFDYLESVSIQTRNAQAALHRAAKHACPAALRHFAARHADVNAEDVDGLRPLHHAIRSGGHLTLESIQTLVTLGADPSRATAKAAAPIQMAKERFAAHKRWPDYESALNKAGRSVPPSNPPLAQMPSP